jgi:hypothetical protein
MHLGYGNRGQVRHKVQLSGDETQWVLQQLQGLGEKKKIAQRIWAWPLDIPDLTVATAALTDTAVAVHPVYPTHVGCSARGCLEQRTRAAVRVQPELDPPQGADKAAGWAWQWCSITDLRLRNTHDQVAPKFQHGPHAGKRVEDLVQSYMRGEDKPKWL